MDLYQEILVKVLSGQEMQIAFSNLKISSTEIIESECFMKTEEILSVFESPGSSGGTRHDFGSIKKNCSCIYFISFSLSNEGKSRSSPRMHPLSLNFRRNTYKAYHIMIDRY